jgi:hypothetical protein
LTQNHCIKERDQTTTLLHIYQTRRQTTLKNEEEHGCSDFNTSSSCSTTDTRRVYIFNDPLNVCTCVLMFIDIISIHLDIYQSINQSINQSMVCKATSYSHMDIINCSRYKYICMELMIILFGMVSTISRLLVLLSLYKQYILH